MVATAAAAAGNDSLLGAPRAIIYNSPPASHYHV
jgi:hypothetical protein